MTEPIRKMGNRTVNTCLITLYSSNHTYPVTQRGDPNLIQLDIRIASVCDLTLKLLLILENKQGKEGGG